MNEISEEELLKGLDLNSGLKQQTKEHRQQLKLNCLNAAIHLKKGLDPTNEELVAAAKEFYAFVRT